MPMLQFSIPFPTGRSQINLVSEGHFLKGAPGLKHCKSGLVNFFVKGSGAALSVNENCDATVRSDLTGALQRILPASCNAADDADARALLMSPSLTLPITAGALNFGTWQGVYFARFREDARGELVVTVATSETSQSDFTVHANQRMSHSITAEVHQALGRLTGVKGSRSSTLLVHEKHTSASVGVAGSDVEPAMRAIVPEAWNQEFFQHTMEGPDDMPGHVKSTLLGCSVSLPLEAGSAALGEGQQIMLNEHRDVGGWGCGHSRRVQVTELNGGERSSVQVQRQAEVTDITAAVSSAIDEARGSRGAGPGLVHIFAMSAASGVVVAHREAAVAFAEGLKRLAGDAFVRAAIAKNGLAVPLDAKGAMLLSEGQSIWLYDGSFCGASSSLAPASIVVTTHIGSGEASDQPS